MSDPLEAAKREQQRTTEALVDAKRQLSEAMDAKAGPPADDPDQAQEQLRTIREGIERDLAALRERIPDKERVVDTVKPVAMAVGGGVAAVFVASRKMAKRKERKRHDQELKEHATALAESFARLDLEAIAARAAAERAEDEGGGSGKVVALVLALAGAAVAVWLRAKSREEPDIWGPQRQADDATGPTEPLATGQPATPSDVTSEVPTIPVDER